MESPTGVVDVDRLKPLLDSLLATGIDEVELRDQILTIVMAGHETTAKSLTWTLHLLSQHPAERARLEDELDRVLRGRTPTAEDFERLPYVRGAISEAMRLYPPVWLISRRCVRAEQVGGYEIPAGALVCVSPYVLHRRAADWPDPERFRPERFLDGEPARHSHSFLPFGGGPRVCIGQHLAMLEAVLGLSMVISQLRLESLDEVVPEALVTLRPRDGLTMSVHPRAVKV